MTEAFRRDNPGAEVHLPDTGPFALETHAVEIADRIRAFLGPMTGLSGDALIGTTPPAYTR